MLEQKKNLQEFIPALILTPEQKIKLIEEKVKRAEAYLKKLNEMVKQSPIR